MYAVRFRFHISFYFTIVLMAALGVEKKRPFFLILTCYLVDVLLSDFIVIKVVFRL